LDPINYENKGKNLLFNLHEEKLNCAQNKTSNPFFIEYKQLKLKFIELENKNKELEKQNKE
jgi:hypothetical protein